MIDFQNRKRLAGYANNSEKYLYLRIKNLCVYIGTHTVLNS
jgi:hypothetical protein